MVENYTRKGGMKMDSQFETLEDLLGTDKEPDAGHCVWME